MTNGSDEHLNRLLSALAPGLAWLVRGRLLLPALLLLASQRPLAFVAGQSLHLFSPLDMLLPDARIGMWAELLSHPAGPTALERMLEDALQSGPLEKSGVRETDTPQGHPQGHGGI